MKLICFNDLLKLKSDMVELLSMVTLNVYPSWTVKTAGHMLVAVIFHNIDML